MQDPEIQGAEFAPHMFFMTGMEVAAFLADKAKTVTVLGRSAIPFKALLGEKVGKIILNVR